MSDEDELEDSGEGVAVAGADEPWLFGVVVEVELDEPSLQVG